MRVMCIQKATVSNDGVNHPSPEVGDIDVVTNDKKLDIGLFYYLDRFGDKLAYLSTCFATLPDTPAEVIEEEETELVTA